MPKDAEIAYVQHLGPRGAEHALHKPFSDAHCSDYLMDVGSILSLLPPLPARILDVGVGTGWTSVFFAQRGYDVVGQDICPDMIALANQNKARAQRSNVSFVVSDYESLGYQSEFDAAVFYDSLHHAVDEKLALKSIYTALRPGGICITLEPGEGHANSKTAVNAVRLYGTTEKDMPPLHIMRVGAQVGFRAFRVHARCEEPKLLLDSTAPPRDFLDRLRVIKRTIKDAVKELIERPFPAPSPFQSVRAYLRASNLVVLVK